ncbi:MAG: ATP-binding protein [Bacteroidota bacterium]
MQKLEDEIEMVSTSNELQFELEKLVSIISIYETSLRSYIITKDEFFLKNKFFSQAEVANTFKQLQVLVNKNANRGKDIKNLKKIIDYRFKLFTDIYILSQTKKVTPEQIRAKLIESNVCSEEMRKMVYKTLRLENQKSKKHSISHQNKLEDSILCAFLLIILSLLILFLSFNKINSDVLLLRKSNEELLYLNEMFTKAEQIANLGHWKINIKTGNTFLSENFYRLLGTEPNSFEPTVENVYQFVHPDDLSSIIKTHNDSLKNLLPTSHVVRFVLPNGKIRSVISVASFTRNNNNELVKIGVNYDVTDQFKKTMELEESNKELKSTNEELNAFNNIVSHDLQEPLRKIQMFVSRLEEKEINLLSQQGKDYFAKIKSASNRMQTLLIDLLNYSRTVKAEKIFEIIDLNEVMQQIQADLSIDIEEKKAIITVEKLPKLYAVHFQMEQLFTNLISNSLKYSQENTIPEIKITTEAIEKNKKINGKIIVDRDYHQILISDNGIGFKQEYADQIFLLFKRLETGSKYSGTGIGLSICKRIIDNHNGFIEVESEINHGTTFFIYFPKNESKMILDI